MDSHDAPDFVSRLTTLAELLDATMPPARAALYFDALADLPLDAVVNALNVAARQCTFMPKPAELRTIAAGGDDELRVEAAWLALKRAMREVGSYASVVFEDAALADTVTAMWDHWPGACLTELSPEMWASTRKAFGRVYRVQLGRNPSGARYLPGICERENTSRMQDQRFVVVKRVEAGSGASRRLSLAEAQAAREVAGIVAPQRGQIAEVVQRALASGSE